MKNLWSLRFRAQLTKASMTTAFTSLQGSTLLTHWVTTKSLHPLSLPNEMRFLKFSNITSQYKVLWSQSSSCHSSEVKSTATSWNVNDPCNSTLIFKLKCESLGDLWENHVSLLWSYHVHCFQKVMYDRLLHVWFRNRLYDRNKNCI